MSEKDYSHLNIGYLVHIEGNYNGEHYEKKQIEFKPQSQETCDLLAAAIAGKKGLYFDIRQKPNPQPFPPDEYGTVKTTIGFVSISQKQFDKLKSA